MNLIVRKFSPVISILLLIIVFLSCSKEDTNNENNTKESINKKWIVENSDEFESIEFDTNGNYIITKNENSLTSKKKLSSKQQATAEEIIVFGTYEILDTDILLLSDFGTIKVDDSDPGNVKFSIKYEGSDTYTYELKVTKAAEFTSTPNTDMLCDNTWNFTKISPIKDTLNLVNFSKAGTCFTTFSIKSQNAGSSIEFGKWKWQDKEETKILITEIEYAPWVLDKDGDVEFEITYISAVKMEMKEVFKGVTYNIAFDTINAGKTKTSTLKKLKQAHLKF